MMEGGVAYISVTSFGDATIQEFDTVLEELLSQNPKALILDLRGNGGGYLLVAQEMLGRFVREGVAVYQEAGDGTRSPHSVLGDGPEAFDIPLVVLLNGGSASASEVVAGALQDYERATVIGEQSFGKGSIQNIFDLADGSAVRITVARWLTPDGRQIQDQGITPNIIVPLTPEDYDNGLDPQLDAAIAFLLGRPLPDSAITPTPEP
jgi:carboxyl-terminal processing protease